MSHACMDRLGLPLRELEFELGVYNPASSLVRTAFVRMACSMEVKGCIFKVNLVCLRLQGSDCCHCCRRKTLCLGFQCM